jgi:hypothetical protein
MVALVTHFKFLPRTYVIGAAASISLAVLVVRASINAQSGRFTDSEGYAWSFSLLFGHRIGNRLVEQGWAVVSQEHQFGTSRSMYKVFMVEYAAASIILMLTMLPILLSLVGMVRKSRFSVRLGWVATLALLGITICEGLAASLGDVRQWICLAGANSDGHEVVSGRDTGAHAALSGNPEQRSSHSGF